jgi:hypothetical protein
MHTPRPAGHYASTHTHTHTHTCISAAHDVPTGKGPGQNNHNNIQALNLIKDSNKSH